MPPHQSTASGFIETAQTVEKALFSSNVALDLLNHHFYKDRTIE
ncbi:hypothetical protein P4E94_00155 [Pontiellaceae bacterium B12219]|nr:hypothetical protein [Pontiellaceae bacterium B12219]